MVTSSESGADVVAGERIHRSAGARALLWPGGTAGLLGVIATLHVVWAATPWPFATRADFAEAVVGVQVERTPAPALTLLVAAGLFAGAAGVLAGAGLLRLPVSDRFLRLGLWMLAVVLGLRGALGLLTSATGLATAPSTYRRLDLMIYSPLCLLLAAGVANTLRRSHR